MKLLRAYLWRATLVPALAIIGILMLLDGLFGFVYELESLRNDYQAWQALVFVLTTLPRRLAEFLPMAILLGALTGLGLLANSGELTVMRAAGMSTSRIAWYVLRPAIFLLVLGALVSEYISPYTEQVAQSKRSMAMAGDEALISRSGLWHREGNEFIYINAVEPNGVLHGITRLIFDKHDELVDSQYISRALYQGDYWSLENIHGSRNSIDRVEPYREEMGRWQVELTPQVLGIIMLDPDRLAFSKLYQYASYLNEQGLSAGEYWLALWQKVAMPFATLGMVLIAVSFIFGPLRSVTMGLRMTAGIMAGVIFHYGQQFVGQLSLMFEVSPILAASIPALVCLVAGVVLVQRVR